MQVANLADVHRLSPLQEEMLAHHIRHPKDDGGLVQLVLGLSGPLSPPALRESCERVVAHHAILRTSFRWQGLRDPFQLVHRRVELPWEVLDGHGDLSSFLAEDRARGLDPAREPLLRFSLLAAGPHEHSLVWTHHRLLLDGRSALRIAGQILTLVRALARGESGDLEPSPPFRKVVELVERSAREDLAEAGSFWRRELAKTSPARPAAAEPPPAGRELRERTLRVAPVLTAALADLGREAQLTTETLVQGAWALLLAGPDGAVKGAEVSFGIPVDAGFAEAAVGPLTQILPLRVTMAPEAPLLPWLLGLRDRQAAVRRHGQVTLRQLEIPPPPLDSQIVDETLPEALALGGASGGGGGEVAVREVRRIEAFRCPLTLAVRSGPELELRMVYDPACFAEPEIARRQERLAALLESLVRDPRQPLRKLAAPGAPPPRPAVPESRRGAVRSEIVPVPRDRPLPATFFQEWALQLEGAATNGIPNALLIDGRIDLPVLRRSMAEVVRRHEALRTSFGWEEGEARLVIAPPGGLPFPVIDLTALPEPRRTETLNRLTAEHAERTFDLARGPLFLAQVVKAGELQHALLMNLHHVIADGWSLQVLQRDLFLVYHAFAAGRPSPLPPLPFQAADFAWWQRRVYAGEALEDDLAWWRRTLTDLPPPPALPIDRPRPAVLGPRALHVDVRLAPGPTRALRGFAQASKCSLSMILFAAVNVLLHTYSGEEDLIVSAAFAARNRRELSGLIGLFLNVFPVRTRLSGNPSFRALSEQVRDAMFEAYARQDVPFPRVLAELFPGRKLTRTTLSGICFNMLNFLSTDVAAGPGAARPGEDLSVRAFHAPKETAKYELVVSAQETGTDVNCIFTGAADLFRQEGLAAVAERFKALLIEAAKDPDIPLDRLRRKLASPAAYSSI